jgi:hypothetical protein
MQALETEDAAVGRMFLSWSGRSARFALEAERILRVVERREWGGEEPRDLTSVLDLDDSVTPVRVLEVQAGASRIGLLAFGAMRLCAVTDENLLDVPEILRAQGTWRLFRQLAVVDGAPALWVLDAESIFGDAFARCDFSKVELFERVDGREGDR